MILRGVVVLAVSDGPFLIHGAQEAKHSLAVVLRAFPQYLIDRLVRMFAIELHLARGLFKCFQPDLSQSHKRHRRDSDHERSINLCLFSRFLRDCKKLIRKRNANRREFARVFLRYAFDLRPITMTIKKRVRRIDLITQRVIALHQELLRQLLGISRLLQSLKKRERIEREPDLRRISIDLMRRSQNGGRSEEHTSELQSRGLI